MSPKNTILSVALLGVAFAGSASAQETATGTLAVTGTIVGSISLTIESAGGASQTGMGTDDATTALGSVSKFGAIPATFTQIRGASDWTLSSTIGVKVVKANSISTAYTLNAKLASVPTSGIVWKVNGTILNAAGVVAMTAAGVYGSTASYPWDIVIADTVPSASALDNTIMFDAIGG